MLGWLVQGFERMVPQPEMLKKLEVSTARPGETGGAAGQRWQQSGLPVLLCTPAGTLVRKTSGEIQQRERETSECHPGAP